MKAHIRPGPFDARYEAAIEHLQRFEVIRDGIVTGDDFIEIVQKVRTPNLQICSLALSHTL